MWFSSSRFFKDDCPSKGLFQLVLIETILRISRFLNHLIDIYDLHDTCVADETAMIATILPIHYCCDSLESQHVSQMMTRMTCDGATPSLPLQGSQIGLKGRNGHE